jgi:hypothetical protein
MKNANYQPCMRNALPTALPNQAKAIYFLWFIRIFVYFYALFNVLKFIIQIYILFLTGNCWYLLTIIYLFLVKLTCSEGKGNIYKNSENVTINCEEMDVYKYECKQSFSVPLFIFVILTRVKICNICAERESFYLMHILSVYFVNFVN